MLQNKAFVKKTKKGQVLKVRAAIGQRNCPARCAGQVQLQLALDCVRLHLRYPSACLFSLFCLYCRR